MLKHMIERQITEILDQNCWTAPKGFSLYYGNTTWRNKPQRWPQFFGPFESASDYVKIYNQNHTTDQYVLHHYQTIRPINLLNFNADSQRSSEIDNLFHLMSQLLPLMSDLTPKKLQENLDGLQVIELFSPILFGLKTHYDRTQIKHIVEDLATKVTFPVGEHVNERFVKQLLDLIETSGCAPSRISFKDYDKMYFNALTFAIEACHLPIDGVFFTRTHARDPCCARVNKTLSSGNTCVPDEYILLRPHKVVTWVPPRR